jgi:hypothetical protein
LTPYIISILTFAIHKIDPIGDEISKLKMNWELVLTLSDKNELKVTLIGFKDYGHL